MIAYLDLLTGLAGDMMVGALLDAGWPEAQMREVLADLRVPDAAVFVELRAQHGIHATGLRVEAVGEPEERSLAEVRTMLHASDLDAGVRDRSLELFERLAEVEGRIHQVPKERVHFHELGAIDSIIDIVLSVAGVQALGISRLHCGPVPLCRGEVQTAHGLMPVPAPATLRLLEGIPIRWIPMEGEWLTPTGALLLAGLVTEFGPPPDFRLRAVGMGAGSRRSPDRANIVRLLVGQEVAVDGEACRQVSVLEANLDDQEPRQLAEIADRLLEAGALDVFRVAVQMKKGRLGTLLVCLCRPEQERDLGGLLLRESLTLGIRVRRETRRELDRWVIPVETPYGQVRMKCARAEDRIRAVPEFEDLRTLSRVTGLPLWEIEQAALAAAREVDREVPPPPVPPAS